MPRARKIPAPSEKAIQAAVLEHWRAFGQPGLTRGLFDLLVLAPGLPVGFLELKRDRSAVVSAAQKEFAYVCGAVGIPCAVTYGRDEPIEILEQWGAVRRVRRAAA